MILSLAVFSLQKTKSAKHPLIIRAWLIFNFLLSVIRMIFDHRSILSDHEYIGFAELTDLSTLVICTHLFAISAREKLGITLINSSITEPLLSPSAAQQTETKRTCLFGRARINRCLEEGPEDFLLKPVQPSDVSRLCSRVLR